VSCQLLRDQLDFLKNLLNFRTNAEVPFPPHLQSGSASAAASCTSTKHHHAHNHPHAHSHKHAPSSSSTATAKAGTITLFVLFACFLLFRPLSSPSLFTSPSSPASSSSQSFGSVRGGGRVLLSIDSLECSCSGNSHITSDSDTSPTFPPTILATATSPASNVAGSSSASASSSSTSFADIDLLDTDVGVSHPHHLGSISSSFDHSAATCCVGA